MSFINKFIEKVRDLGTTALAFIVGLLVAFSFEELFPYIINPLVGFIGNVFLTYVLICVIGVIVLWYILEKNPFS